ncbi:MAG: acyl carrier protein phosphodiesterase [Putridiphycobacter sp.]
MNFLGHCFLTRHQKKLIPGNLAGDFYKGDLAEFKSVPKHIMKGVEIHRFIDSYTDNHPSIQAAAHILQKNGITRISYIAIDILLDHHLAKKWRKYSSRNLGRFIGKIYSQTEKELEHLPTEFEQVFKKMKQKDWLSRYESVDGIDLTLHKFGMRLNFTNNLHEVLPVYLKHKKEIDKLFKHFLKDIDKTVQDKFSL